MGNHPIKPPSDLIREWARFNGNNDYFHFEDTFQRIAEKAAQWGADRQLELAEGFLVGYLGTKYSASGVQEGVEEFRKAMRPKPMSKKQRAKNALSQIMASQKGMFGGKPFSIVKEALDSLPND